LDEFVPLRDNSADSIVELHVDAEAGISLWKDKCAAKLQKLSTCYGQSVFSLEFVQSLEDEGQRKHRSSCPFVLSPELKTVASIMYGPCLVIFHHDDMQGVLCDAGMVPT
jgi:hypothetical protein